MSNYHPLEVVGRGKNKKQIAVKGLRNTPPPIDWTTGTHDE